MEGAVTLASGMLKKSWLISFSAQRKRKGTGMEAARPSIRKEVLWMTEPSNNSLLLAGPALEEPPIPLPLPFGKRRRG